MSRQFVSTRKLVRWISGFAIVGGFILAPLLYALVSVASILVLKMVLDKKFYTRLVEHVEGVLSNFRAHSDA